jgi:hypothetical protein
MGIIRTGIALAMLGASFVGGYQSHEYINRYWKPQQELSSYSIEARLDSLLQEEPSELQKTLSRLGRKQERTLESKVYRRE